MLRSVFRRVVGINAQVHPTGETGVAGGWVPGEGTSMFGARVGVSGGTGVGWPGWAGFGMSGRGSSGTGGFCWIAILLL